MSTFPITVPDSLAERMTEEEIRLFLEEQLRRLEAEQEFFIAPRTLTMIENSVQNLQSGSVGAPIEIAHITSLLRQLP
jgi:hypothetical protein